MADSDKNGEKTPGEHPRKGSGNHGNGRPFTPDDPRINRNGRPKKGEALADLMKEFMVGEQKFTIEGRRDGEVMERRRAFVRMCYQEAMKGREGFARMIWQWHDGLPPLQAAVQVFHAPYDDEELTDENVQLAVTLLAAAHPRTIHDLRKVNGNGNSDTEES